MTQLSCAEGDSAMKILDHFMDTLSDTGQNVKGATEISQYKFDISDRRRQLTQLYAEIGEAYYFYHRDDVNAEERERIVRASALRQEIEDLEDKIRLVRGLVRCPHCREEVPAGTTFCGKCGYRIIPPDSAASGIPDAADGPISS